MRTMKSHSNTEYEITECLEYSFQDQILKLHRLQTRAKKLIVNAKYEDGWTCKWITFKSFISFDQEGMTKKLALTLSRKYSA